MAESVPPVAIPTRLAALGERFIRVAAHEKRPLDPGWPEHPMAADAPVLVAHLSAGGNYGTVCGNRLGVLDLDDAEVAAKVMPDLPSTLLVRTGSGGHHLYYIIRSGWGGAKVVLGRGDTHIGELQGHGTMVVGPGSIHPSGQRYEVIEDHDIAEVSLEDIMRVLAPYLPPPAEVAEAATEERRTEGRDLPTIDITRVVPMVGLKLDRGRYRGPHPVHGSRTGTNFVVDPDTGTWYCHRCRSGGGPLLYLAMELGLLDCAQARKGTLRGAMFVSVLRAAVAKGYLPASAINQPMSCAIHEGVVLPGVTLAVERDGNGFVTVASNGGDAIYRLPSKSPPWDSGQLMGQVSNGLYVALPVDRRPAKAVVQHAVNAYFMAVAERLGADEGARKAATESPLVMKVLEATEEVVIYTGSSPRYGIRFDGHLHELSIKEMNGPPGVLADLWLTAHPQDIIHPTGKDWDTVRGAWLARAVPREREDVSPEEVLVDSLILFLNLRIKMKDTVQGLGREYGGYLQDDTVWISTATIQEWLTTQTIMPKMTLPVLSGLLLEKEVTTGTTRPHHVGERQVRGWPFAVDKLRLRGRTCDDDEVVGKEKEETSNAHED